jgi:hypothetical protein
MTRDIDRFFEQLFWSIMSWIIRLFGQLLWLMVQLMMPVLEELMAIVGPVLVRLLMQPLIWSFVAILVLWAMTDRGAVAIVAAVTAASGVVIFVMVRERTL